MSKKKEDNLGSFFRKGLGAHDFEFREDDWVQLEARLDEADRSRALFWRNVFAISTAALIGLTLFLLNLSGDRDSDDHSLPSISSKSGSQDDDVFRDESLESTGHREVGPAGAAKEGVAKDGDTEKGMAKAKAGDTEEKDSQKDYDGDKDKASLLAASPGSGKGPGKGSTENLSQPDSRVFYYSSEAGPSTQGPSFEQIHISDILASAAGVSVRSKRAGSLTEPPEFTAVIQGIGAPDSGMVKETALKPDVDSRFALGLSLGPDLSSVGTSDYTNPGFSLGANLEYYVLPKLTINGGLVVGTKQYLAKGREYGKGRGLWTRGVVPDTTMGQCLVLDIPINIRYYPIAGARHRVFISSGISSYVFLTEDYQFLYEMNAPDLIQGWSGRNEIQNYFGVINFSLGYELHLQSEFYLQVEPIFKLPVDQLGFGNVELTSAGVYFTIKYRFHRRRTTLDSNIANQ